MSPRRHTPGPTTIGAGITAISILLHILLWVNTAGAALSTPPPIKSALQDESGRINLELKNFENSETTDANIILPKLAPIPRSEEVRPRTADEIEPSEELKKIIKQVKNGTLPEYSNKKPSETDYSIKAEDLAIIKAGGKPVKAEEVRPSPALEAVLAAYRNGSIDYTRRDIKEVEEELFYHQPYAEVDMASIYDLVVLRTGRDVFLSLDYQQLGLNGKTVEELRSRRIKDLQQTITAIKVKEKRKRGEETDEHGEKHINPPVKIKIKPKETFARRMLNLLGIRRKDETVDYEKLSVTYRAYKRWSKHIQDVDEMFRRKRRQKIQLLHQRRYRPSKRVDCNDPAFRGICPDGQLKINPYKNGNIRFLKP
ncbi:hypothetical protein [Desulfovibrio sp. JC010]|uniref:hypothetical protein n=1 Tax=Desulfovibrio sp. JC010 TaxID=2593641 RepID=UPI0013D8CB9D|nr:hypothetical protein [Desulfovibrio sp. JC010]NDV25590.1 hypothetical protein [Desulfovibrio sp. JC010]